MNPNSDAALAEALPDDAERAFRSQLEKAMKNGYRSEVQQALADFPQARAWITGEVIAQAAILGNPKVILILLENAEDKAQVAGALSLIHKNDRNAIKALARMSGDGVRKTLIMGIAKSEDLGLMSAMASIYYGEDGLRDVLESALVYTAKKENWKMARHLLNTLHSRGDRLEDVGKVLRPMVVSSSAPGDLIEHALSKWVPYKKYPEMVGDLMIHAAKAGCTTAMPRFFLPEYCLPGWAKLEAFRAGVKFDHEQVLDFLMLHVNDLGDELGLQMGNTNPQEHQRLVVCATEIGRRLAPDPLKIWATRFDGQNVPGFQAILREHGTVSDGSAQPLAAGRSRVRP